MDKANTPPVVSPQEWEAARQRLLVREKELTRARDALAAQRRCAGPPGADPIPAAQPPPGSLGRQSPCPEMSQGAATVYPLMHGMP